MIAEVAAVEVIEEAAVAVVATEVVVVAATEAVAVEEVRTRIPKTQNSKHIYVTAEKDQTQESTERTYSFGCQAW
jgi:hypothetical protein